MSKDSFWADFFGTNAPKWRKFPIVTTFLYNDVTQFKFNQILTLFNLLRVFMQRAQGVIDPYNHSGDDDVAHTHICLSFCFTPLCRLYQGHLVQPQHLYQSSYVKYWKSEAWVWVECCGLCSTGLLKFFYKNLNYKV